jgi:hypothetical protein
MPARPSAFSNFSVPEYFGVLEIWSGVAAKFRHGELLLIYAAVLAAYYFIRRISIKHDPPDLRPPLRFLVRSERRV